MALYLYISETEVMSPCTYLWQQMVPLRSDALGTGSLRTVRPSWGYFHQLILSGVGTQTGIEHTAFIEEL